MGIQNANFPLKLNPYRSILVRSPCESPDLQTATTSINRQTYPQGLRRPLLALIALTGSIRMFIAVAAHEYRYRSETTPSLVLMKAGEPIVGSPDLDKLRKYVDQRQHSLLG